MLPEQSSPAGEENKQDRQTQKEVLLAALEEAIRANFELFAGTVLREIPSLLDEVGLEYVQQSHDETIFDHELKLFESRARELGFSEQHITYASDVVRHANLLDGAGNRLLTSYLSCGDDVLKKYIADVYESVPEMLASYDATSIEDFFRIVHEYGRTRLFFWNEEEKKYLPTKISAERESVLPWGGRIMAGGPDDVITRLVLVNQELTISLNDDSIAINGEQFFFDEAVAGVE